jgi:hypothetical protein
MRTLRALWRLTMPAFFILGGLTAAGAQEVSPEVQQACTPDAMRLCQEFVPDRAKITACMMRNRRQLSAECLTAMRGSRGAARHYRGRERRVRYRHHHHD